MLNNVNKHTHFNKPFVTLREDREKIQLCTCISVESFLLLASKDAGLDERAGCLSRRRRSRHIHTEILIRIQI